MKKLILLTLATTLGMWNGGNVLAKTFNLEGQVIDPDQRITQAMSARTISGEQAAKFRNEELKLSLEENKMRNKHGGVLTAADQKNLYGKVRNLMTHIDNVANLKVDNTGRNIGDSRTGVSTPQTQSETQGDVNIISAIRRRLMKDRALSSNGKNVKVICAKGSVTLRNPVDNAAEKQEIGNTAKTCAGVSNVKNELDIKQ